MNKGERGKLRAFFDLKTSEGFIIKGFKLVEGISGLFVGMPSTQGKDGEYYDTIFADKELRDQLQQVALRCYGQESMTVSESGSATPNEQKDAVSTPEPQASTEAPSKNESFSDDDIPF